MPTYLWEGTNKFGESRNGALSAENEGVAAERLRAQGLTITKVKKKPMELVLPTIGSGISLRDMVVFTRTFSTMIDAGLPMVQCLEMLSNQADNPRFRKVLAGVK